MRILLIGHLCKDIVHSPASAGDDPKEHFGGIMFAVKTFANLLSPEDRVIPIFGVGAPDRDALMADLNRFACVETQGIFTIDGPTNQVHLFYDDRGSSRTECSRDISEPIPYSRIEPFLPADGISVNMVSGFDITLETLDQVRMQVRDRRIPMHFDFHSLTLGVRPDFTRFRRPLEGWRRWCFMMHAVQMNEEEAGGLTAECPTVESLVHQLLSLMVGALIITRGPAGATLFTQDAHKRLSRHDIPGRSDTRVADPTGCGDVFGAAYFTEFLRTRDDVGAASFANNVAAINATLGSSDELSSIPARLRELETLNPASHMRP